MLKRLFIIPLFFFTQTHPSLRSEPTNFFSNNALWQNHKGKIAVACGCIAYGGAVYYGTASSQIKPAQALKTIATRMGVGTSVGGLIGGAYAMHEINKELQRDPSSTLSWFFIAPVLIGAYSLIGGTAGGALGLACSPHQMKTVAQEAVRRAPDLAQNTIKTAKAGIGTVATTAQGAVNSTTQLLQAFFTNLKG